MGRRLVFPLRRRPELTREEFQSYWLASHAPLVASWAETVGIVRYQQVHTVHEAREVAVAAFDGVAELWVEPSIATGTPEERRRAGAEMLTDERSFIDLAASPIWMAEEHVLRDGPVGGLRMTAALRRRAGTTRSQFLRHWHDVHGLRDRTDEAIQDHHWNEGARKEGEGMPFDLRTYKQRAGRVQVDDLDFDAFIRQPLDADSLRCLRYMHDIEHHTICYLRELLMTRAHQDHEVTSFLTIWAFEEFWHGEAIAAVLAAHDELAGAERVTRLRQAQRRRDRLSPYLHGLGSAITGRAYTAIHMTWGAVNEWVAQAAYARLAARADHPVLTQLLPRLMRQEGKHVDFYASEAAQRLSADKRARWLTRLALDRFWSPVGSDLMPAEEVRFMNRHLFSGREGREMMTRIDRRIDRLPGLAGLELMQRAHNRYAA